MIEILERTKEFKAETALVVEGKEITYSDLHLQSDLIASYLLNNKEDLYDCLLYTSPSPRDVEESRMPSSA